MRTARRLRTSRRGLALGRLVPAVLLVLPALALLSARSMGSVDLKPGAVEAFAHYVQLTEARMASEAAAGTSFLWIDTLAPAARPSTLAALRRGDVISRQLRTLDQGRVINAPGALIKHWHGTVFIPGVSLAHVVEIFQDYDRHQEYFSATVMRSKLLERHDNLFKVYLRFKLVKVWTAILNTEHEFRYEPLGPTRLQIRAVSTRIAQVEDADTPAEHEDPIGKDDGYLWRVNSYWRIVERDGGVYIQCESIAMGRDIPFMFRWIIEPILTGFARDLLVSTLESARAACMRPVPIR